MGFLRRIFGPKKKTAADSTSNSHHNWSLIRSDKNRLAVPNDAASYGGLDANNHAIAVAAATAAVAEAALAAAKAAAEVVRLTSGRGARKAAAPPQSRGRLAPVSVEEWAAVKIQSAFRGYLARRALRALKALVKLQALVRGYIVRKQMSDMLRRMQTLVRLQTRARVSRSHGSISTAKSSLFQNPRTYRDGIDVSRPKLGSNWLEHWMEDNAAWDSPSYTQPRTKQDDERSTKILEVDTWKPSKESRLIHGQTHLTFDSDSPSRYSSKAPNLAPSLSSEEPVTVRSVRGEKVRSGHNSPQVVTSAPTKRPGSSGGPRKTGPFTPARSECSWSFYNGYSSHPNFMANTESSRAKVRSQSTPRQREFGSPKRAHQVSWDGGSFMNPDRRNRRPNLR